MWAKWSVKGLEKAKGETRVTTVVEMLEQMVVGNTML